MMRVAWAACGVLLTHGRVMEDEDVSHVFSITVTLPVVCSLSFCFEGRD